MTLDPIIQGILLMLCGVCLVAAVSGVANTDGECDKTHCEDCPFPCDRRENE